MFRVNPQRLVILHRQHMGYFLFLQPTPQPAVIAVHRISGHPAKGHANCHRPGNHHLCQLPFGAKDRLCWHAGFPPTLPILRPNPGQVQLPIQKGRAPPAAIYQEHADLTVLHLPRRPAVLPPHPHRLLALLQKPRLIHHQYASGIAQMLHHVPLQVVPHLVSVPLVHPRRRCTPSGVASPAYSTNCHPFSRSTYPSNPCRYARTRCRDSLRLKRDAIRPCRAWSPAAQSSTSSRSSNV